jgi:glutathione S-transferase
MTGTFLMISSKNYSSWSLRGWLLCRMAGLDFVEEVVPADDANRAELLPPAPAAARSAGKCIRGSPICGRRCR